MTNAEQALAGKVAVWWLSTPVSGGRERPGRLEPDGCRDRRLLLRQGGHSLSQGARRGQDHHHRFGDGAARRARLLGLQRLQSGLFLAGAPDGGPTAQSFSLMRRDG